MDEILILGSLPETEERRILYESMTQLCQKYTKKVYSPIDTTKFNGDRYQRALQKIEDASLIIGEQSEPSTGQGMEIGYSLRLNIPVIIVAKKGSKVSGLMKTCPSVKQIIYYEDISDLEKKLENILQNL